MPGILFSDTKIVTGLIGFASLAGCYGAFVAYFIV